LSKNNFDNTYLKWKSWGEGSQLQPFGSISIYQADYYRKVMSLSGVSKNSKILEVGFGNGGFLKYCGQQSYDIVGTELNADLLRVAGNAGYEVFGSEFLEKAEPSSFDFIFAFDVIEHIYPEDVVSFLASCKRVLRPGGIAFFRFPNGDSPMAMPNFNADITHVNWIGRGKIDYYSQAAGFQSCEVLATPELIVTRSLPHALYHCVVLPIKAIINLMARILFYPGRRLNFVAVDLVAMLKK
jgi:2-polyprenyl-3-methyl-5-hydroxy-6-metoxy-1,4-benzoquinol methylase